MHAYTLRGIDDKLYRSVQQRSRSAGKSMNKYMLELIARDAGGMPQDYARRQKEIDSLVGSMSAEDHKHYCKALREQRKIDPEMWK